MQSPPSEARMTGTVVWFTGLPSSGKTTLAHAVEKRLLAASVAHCLLDGDEMRHVLVPELGYSSEERVEFYATLARLAGALARQGLVVLVPATAHRREYRDYARQQAPRFLEIWLMTPLFECRTRDSKGLYESAAKVPGHLPGVDVNYEPPNQADVLATGGADEAAVERILGLLGPDV
jgi:adenylylsulfate kinase